MYKRGYIIYTHAYVCTNGGIYKVIIGVIFFLLFFCLEYPLLKSTYLKIL